MSNVSKEYHREWYHKNKDRIRDRKNEAAKKFRQKRLDFIIQQKSKPCADCNQSYPHYVMDFDHAGDKLFTISDKRASVSMEELEAEIAKCEVVCANCHRIRTHEKHD